MKLEEALGVLADALPTGGSLLTVRPASLAYALTSLAGDVRSLTGIKPKALKRYPGLWLRAIHPEDRGELATALAQLDSRDRVTVEYRVVTMKGEERWVREDLACPPGDPRVAIGILQDISDGVELRRRVETLERRLLKAQRMEALGALSSGIAHDFDKLWTTVTATTQILELESDLDEQEREDLRSIRNAAERGSTLVRQILDFAGREGRSDGEVVDVTNVIQSLGPILSRSLGEDIDLEIDPADQVWPVRGDRSLMEQVVLNLVVNAREAMRRGGTLTIRSVNVHLTKPMPLEADTLAPGRYVALSVRDTGVGIAERVRRRLFDRHGGTRTEPAVGVGLATVRSIVKQWNGAISVDSSLGQGTTFYIYLPVVGTGVSAPPEAALPRDEDGTRVLLVESRPALRNLIERTLTGMGYSLVVVGTAREAIEVFDRVKPRFQLVMIEARLPSRPGQDVYRALSRRVDRLPVVFIADHPGAQVDAGEGLAEGVWLENPLSPVALHESVLKALAGGTEGQAAQVGA